MVHSLPRAPDRPSVMGTQAHAVFLWEMKWSRSGPCLSKHSGDSLDLGEMRWGSWPQDVCVGRGVGEEGTQGGQLHLPTGEPLASDERCLLFGDPGQCIPF